MENSQQKSQTVISVTISQEMADKLALAYVGLPAARQNAILEREQNEKISRKQATFEDLLYPQILKYEAKAPERSATQLAAFRAMTGADLTDAQIIAIVRGTK